MDLDVGSYNTDELMEALGVDTPRDQVTGVSGRSVAAPHPLVGIDRCELAV